MTKRYVVIISIITVLFFPVDGQVKKTETELKREVTLYNPYKPSLADAKKRSYLPEIVDTAKLKPVFRYNITSKPFSPTYTINPIKPASLLSDPLPKLYKSFIKIGLGNNNTPLGEISISNTRSKKGTIGLYARHYSSNGKVPLENDQRVFAGFMDNNATLYGKKFFGRSYLDLSASYIQRVRYAYGYDPEQDFSFNKKDIKLNYYDAGGKVSYASLNLDSADLAYDFDLTYDFFHDIKERTMNHTGFGVAMSKLYKGFYIGGDMKIDHYRMSDSLQLDPKYLIDLTPFVRKSTGQWAFNLGVRLDVEKNMTESPKIYFYPDFRLSFNIVPEYVRFIASLEGRLENNDPLNVINENPYLIPDGSLFRVPNTKHSIIITAGLKGNNGLGGNYQVTASYSAIKDLILFSNVVYPDTASKVERGNHFIVLPDDAELLNINAEFNGSITEKFLFDVSANYYHYSLIENQFAWNKPNWKGKFGLFYNLRNKIIAGAEINAIGKRNLLVSKSPTGWMTLAPVVTEEPVHINLGISAEYRYSKILSFWLKINNISWKRYYEWAYYPSQMFNFMVGFSYSL